MARVMIVAGGDWQVPLVKKAKAMGHTVLCTNLYAKSPAFEFADDFAVVDVLDKEKNLEIAKKWKPDVVLTDQSDIAVPTVAYISEKMNLPGIGSEKANLFTNKYEMRCFEKKHGFQPPKFMLCKSYEAAKACFDQLGVTDAIIKPVDSQSSRGVYRIRENEDFGDKYAQAEKFSSSGCVIFEEYIDGEEFTIDGIMINGEYHTLGISRKKHYLHNAQIASDLLFTWDDEEYDYVELEKINRQHIVEAGLPFGLTHSEYKCFNGQYYLIEMAARGGGTLISSDIAPFMSSVDGPGTLLDLLLGKKLNIKECRDNKAALLHFLDVNPGKIKKIEGFKEASNISGVHKIHLDFKEGDILNAPNDDRGRAGFVIIFANNKKEILKKLNLLNEVLVIQSEPV